MQTFHDNYPLPPVWTLTCYCQNSHLCDGDIDVCHEPHAVCLIQISTVNANPVYEYGCQEHANDHFNDHIIMEACLEGPIVSDFVSTQCCNESGCNEHLNPPLPLAFRSRTTIPIQDPTTSTAPITPSSGTGIKI